MSGEIGVFSTPRLRGKRERERECILKLKFWGGKETAILGGTIACIRRERDREHAFQKLNWREGKRRHCIGDRITCILKLTVF